MITCSLKEWSCGESRADVELELRLSFDSILAEIERELNKGIQGSLNLSKQTPTKVACFQGLSSLSNLLISPPICT